MKKIRVVLAAHVGEPWGGISTYFEAILNSDLKDHVELHFIETSKGFLRSSERGRWKFINWINALENILEFLLVIVTIKPDLVHIGTAYGASFAKHSLMVYISRLFNIPVIIQPHCSPNKLIPEHSSHWRTYVLFSLSLCEGIIIISKEWDMLLGLFPNINIRYIPNVIDVKPYMRLPRPREIANGQVNILYLGRIHWEKGLFDLINAVAIIHNMGGTEFQVNIVGESLSNEELESVKESIESNDLQGIIKIFEPEYGERKINRFALTDIFVLPSYYEGMPMSIIEAMAAGLPVVGSSVGGIPQLIEEQETGFMVNPGDVQALSTYLLELINSPEKRLVMGASGRRKVAQYFDIENAIEPLVSLYQEIVSTN